ncbi:MAG: HAD hydrolase-like protein [Natronospirillum sp.]|uniref:HAD family hydrolase n=1 Tax=Natronospirillum sp. TaxID=2812955 RepID=UPI0025F5F627|nr:HAD hydrolase-like protein [Natronospirillum sp.]MCH8550865.1 HAD hydrolase-like protein [Natronospirillum sp.]
MNDATTVSYDLYLFDLDGTISDPILGIGRSFNYALTHFGYEPLSNDQIGPCIGPPLDTSFARITGTESQAEVLELVAKYRERYAEIGFAENTLYPGVKEVLETLYERGTRMAVCTSKRRDFAERILERFELAHLLNFVDGGDVGIEKWQQIAAMREDGRLTGSALMIGDRAVDLEAARRNDIVGGAVLWGYGSVEELQSESPGHWFRSPKDWLAVRCEDFQV